MAEETKFTEEELKQIKEIQDSYFKIQTNEKTFLNGITEKYGEGSLDPETGVFTPSAEFPKNN